MALSFAINPDAGETFSDAEQKRKDARMLIAAALGHTPQNVGEGLSAIGQALIARQMNQEAAAAEKTNAGINQSLLQGIFGGAGAFPAAPGAAPVAPNASPVATDVPSQRVAQAFAASGGAPDTGKGDRVASLGPTVSPQAYFGPEVDVSKLPAGMRNNNPGNIKFVGQNVPGIVGPSVNTDQGDPQAVFSSPLAGMQAAASLALRKNQGGKRTINELIAGQGGWTPGNTQAAANIAATMGVSPYVDVDLSNPEMMQRFLRGLVTQEHGPSSKLYSDDLIAQAVNGSPAAGAVTAFANGQSPAPPLPAPVNVPDMPVAAPQPVQVAQAANTGTPGTMSDADALKLLGAEPYKPGLNNMQAIAAALGSPAASPTTQRIAAALLEQRMKPNDFGFQTLPDGTVLRTDPRSGTVQPIYQGQGKAPTVQQFFDPQTGQPYEAQWNPKTQSWDKVGGVKIPANGLSVTLPDGTVIQQGGKPGADPQSRETASDVITNAAGKIRDLSKSFGSTGLLGAAESYLPNTNAAEIYRQVGVLKSNASIEALNAMRRESKTGGALGSVTEKEEAMLAAKAGALDPKSPYFQTQLDDYERTLLRIVHGKEAGDKIYEQTRGQENGGTTSNGLKWSIEP